MDELNILKLDLDLNTKKETISYLFEKLSYAHDLSFLRINKIDKIELIKKKTYGAKIYLNFNFSNFNNLILFQSILGSDYKKEMNSLINYHKLKFNYSNRLFDIKRYSDGSYIIAEVLDITKIIKDLINNSERKEWKN